MKHLIFFVSLILAPYFSLAGLEGTIQTGRPGQAIGAGIVPIGAFQLQTGFDYLTAENPGFKQTNQTMNNILRFGLTKKFEVSSILNYSQDEFDNNGIVTDQSGVSQFQLGFRYNLLPKNDESWLPMLALQTRFRLKQVSSVYKNNDVAPVFLLSMTKNLTDSWGVALNYGMAYTGNDSTPTYNYVLSLSKSISRRWSTVYEIWGNERAATDSTYLGAGLGYLLDDNFQLDGYISTGNNRGIKEFYTSIGFSWRTLVFDQLGPVVD